MSGCRPIPRARPRPPRPGAPAALLAAALLAAALLAGPVPLAPAAEPAGDARVQLEELLEPLQGPSEVPLDDGGEEAPFDDDTGEVPFDGGAEEVPTDGGAEEVPTDSGGGEAPAEEGDGELLEEFGDVFREPPPGQAPAPAPSEGEPGAPGLGGGWGRLEGSAKLASAYNYAQEPPTPQRNLSKLRAQLRLDLKLELGGSWDAQVSGIAFHDYAYQIKGRDRFTDQVLEQYEQEAEFRELFVRGALLDDLDVQLGRQIEVWGAADFIRVNDVLNPIDNREPGLADVEDLRLPVGMARLEWFFGDWSLTGVAIPEIEFNKEPVFGSDFYPLPRQSPVPGAPWPPREEVPSDGGDHTEYAAALQGFFTGFDLGFFWTEHFDDNPHLENVAPPGQPPEFRLRHSRLVQSGASLVVAAGNWILKGEAARVDGLEFNNATEDKTRIDALLGFDYTGFSETTVTVEAVNRRIQDFEKAMERFPDFASEDRNQYVLAYRRDLLHQRLHLQGVWIFFGETGDEGGLQRYQAEYDLLDDLSLLGGVLVYQSAGDGNRLLQAARNNDRFFAQLSYHF